MRELEQLTVLLKAGQDLNSSMAARAAALLTAPASELESKSDFLIALSDKGETVTEVAAFASTFRDLAVDPQVQPWAERAIDVCGTGGDGAHTFNISTAVSFILAAAGVPVFKHGNRSITSKCGSADLMEALGFDLQASHDVQRASLEALNFCFFFAPAYHPAFKEIMPVRKALAASGRRSIFNLLGPLINPGRPAHQLLGVFSNDWVKPLAETLGALGLESGLVVHGRPSESQALDELSCVGHNQVAGFGRLAAIQAMPTLAELGLSACNLEVLQGGDVDQNLLIMQALMDGGDSNLSPGLRDSILLNAGAALWIVRRVSTLADGIESARELVQSGALKDWMRRVQAFYRKT